MIHYSADEVRGTCGECDGLVGVAQAEAVVLARLLLERCLRCVDFFFLEAGAGAAWLSSVAWSYRAKVGEASWSLLSR